MKEFLSAHSGSVLRISETGSNSIAAIVEPGADAQMPAPDANDSAPPSPPATLPLKFRKYELNNDTVWSLTPNSHTLRLHNDMMDPVDVYIAPQNSQDFNPWTHFKIESWADASTPLKAPDPYIVRLQLSNGSGRSRPGYLHEFLDDHPDYVMALRRTYKQVVVGAPLGAPPGSAESASQSSSSPGNSATKPKPELPPVSVGPVNPQVLEDPTQTLTLEWDTTGN